MQMEKERKKENFQWHMDVAGFLTFLFFVLVLLFHTRSVASPRK